MYCSNESDRDVYFDNLQVVHNHGPLAEETHYYPFGLTMTGISSQAMSFGQPDNKRLFNGNELQNKEFSDLSGLEWTDFNARSYDQQTGRFLQIDPDIEDGQESFTPYQFGLDNPARYNDPSGKVPGECCAIAQEVFTWFQEQADAQPEVKPEVIITGAIVAGLSVMIDLAMDAPPGTLGTSMEHAGPAPNAFLPSAQTKTNTNANTNQNSTSSPKTEATTSREARREVMRQQKIPTSSQPTSQSKNESGKEYTYGKKSVQQQTKDRSHPDEKHWEAGTIKVRDGKVQKNEYGRPKLENNPPKSKVTYHE